MGQFLDETDLAPFATIDVAKAGVMIEDAEALALLAAPCLSSSFTPAISLEQSAAVKAILRGAILRWNEAGTGALAGQTAGPFGQTIDTRQPRRNMFWPSEIEQLQGICRGSDDGGIFSVDTASDLGGLHLPWCALNFGATYCSCGVDIAGTPVFEL